MEKNLMLSKWFAPFFWTQFFSAFNDNLVKNILIFLILFQLSSHEAAFMVTVAGALLLLPFLLFSAVGGEVADKYDKGKVAEKLKFIEIGAAVIAIIGIGLSSITIVMIALLFFGFISALFGPVKYGILPDHIDAPNLAKANAWVSAGTFLAILSGTVMAGMIFNGHESIWLFAPIMLFCSVLCWIFSRYIPQIGAAEPKLEIDFNILRSTRRLFLKLGHDKRIKYTTRMVSWFWMIGVIILSLVPVFTQQILGGNEISVIVYLAVFAISIGIGSAMAAWLTAGRINLVLAPIGTVFVTVFLVNLSFILWNLEAKPMVGSLAEFLSRDNVLYIGVNLSGLAIAGAFMVVPTFTAIQIWAPEKNRARIAATVNISNAFFIVVGMAIIATLQFLKVDIPELLAGLGLINLVIAGVMFYFLPTNPIKNLIAVILRIAYRIEIKGTENIAKAGQAPIIVFNHVSYLDGMVAFTLMDKEPIFAVDNQVTRKWWVKPFLTLCHFKSFDSSDPKVVRSLIHSIKNGHPLVIFPERRMTETGSLMKIYDGTAIIAQKADCMLLPVRIDGLERSFFSKLSAIGVRRKLFPKVKVTIIEPQKLEIPHNLSGQERRVAGGAELYRIMSELMFKTTDTKQTIVNKLIQTAQQAGMKKIIIEDMLTGALSYGRLLTGISVLARKFDKILRHQTNIGVLLPNANGTAVTIFGLMSAGKVPAMMNFTAGANNILAASKAAKVSTILSSRTFIEQANLEDTIAEIEKTIRIIWLDDMRREIGFFEKMCGALLKTRIIRKKTAHDPALILFTSGSEGTPKGVVLTHHNILTNIAQVAARVDFNSSDKLFNILPVFHSFGLTAGLILPLVSGVSVYMYPSPLHYRIIPELIYDSNATIIFGTDTFLIGYARTASPYDFRSVRYCFAGAEPVKVSTREIYMEKFGIRILEGYGVTEASPVIALNTPMYNRSGTVGQFLPGIEYRLEAIPSLKEGQRLFIRGANIMAGYLSGKNPGVLNPPEDGWHDTGDIVSVDENGFITICGRAKRFAKIAGEMVSLTAVEQLAGEVWPNKLSVVISVPDAKKGERLVLLTEAEQASRKDFIKIAKAKKIMDLMIPSEVQTGTVPLLGSGKIDLVTAHKIVLELKLS